MSNDSENFTYKVDNQAFLGDIISFLEYEGKKDISKSLQGGKCNVLNSGRYGHRHNAIAAYVEFRIPLKSLLNLEKKYEKGELEGILEDACKKMIDKDIGFDIYGVKILPSSSHDAGHKTLS